MNVQHKPNKTGGFTIIEVIFALLVLVVAVGGLLSTMSSASRLDRATKERSVATNAARKVLEETKVQFATVDEYVAFYQGLNTTANLVNAVPTGYKTLVTLNNAQGTINVIKQNDYLMTLTVTVAWTGAMGATAVTVQTEVGK